MASSSGAKSIVRRLFEPLRKTENNWPDPEASAGQFLQVLGRYHCWEAEGPAREAFNLLAEEVLNYLHEFSDSVSSTVTWSLYMTGRQRKSSRPTIAFVSADASARRKVRKLIQESGLLLKYPGFVLMDCNRPPGFQTLVALGSETPESAHKCSESTHKINLRIPRSNPFGLALSVFRITSDATAPIKGTGGAILRWNDRTFLTTAGHIFQDQSTSLFPLSDDAQDFEFDLDGDDFSFDEDVEDDLAELTSRGSHSPEIEWAELNAETSGMVSVPSLSSEMSQLSCESVVTALLISSSPDEEPDQQGSGTISDASSVSRLFSTSYDTKASSVYEDDVIELQGPFMGTSRGQEDSLDYALVELNDQGSPFIRDILSIHDIRQEIEPSVLSCLDTSHEVIILTAMNGPTRGRLSGTPTYACSRQNTKHQELWTVYMEDSITNGDCGSLVIHATEPVVYGHLIAGSPESGCGFVVPFRDVMLDVRKRFGGDWDIAGGFRKITHLKDNRNSGQYHIPNFEGKSPDVPEKITPMFPLQMRW